MKVINLDTRYMLIRHWFRWYIVTHPQNKNKTNWTPLKKSRKNTTDKP